MPRGFKNTDKLISSGFLLQEERHGKRENSIPLFPLHAKQKA
jgi:hypothetical protein